MLDLIRKTILIGSGLALLTTEKIEETVKEVVQRGQISEKEGRELIDDLVARSKKMKREFRERVDRMVQETLQRLNVPTRREVDELRARLDLLEKAAETRSTAWTSAEPGSSPEPTGTFPATGKS